MNILRSGDQPQPWHDGVALWRRCLSGASETPKDKAKVENGGPFFPGLYLRRMPRQTLFSLAEANAAIVIALDCINDHWPA